MFAVLTVLGGIFVLVAVYAARPALRSLSSRQRLAFLVATLVAAISVLAGSLVAFLFVVGTCDESCDPSTGLWIDDPDAWQWDLLGALVLGAAGVAVALCVFIAREWIVAVWIAAVGYGVLVVGHVGLWVSGWRDGTEVEVTWGLLYPIVLSLLVAGEIVSASLARKPRSV